MAAALNAGDGRRRIDDLMWSAEGGWGQRQGHILRTVGKTIGGRLERPFGAGAEGGGAKFAGNPVDDTGGFDRLRCDDRWCWRLLDCRFLTGYGSDVRTQKRLMVERYRGNYRCQGIVDDVGGVVAAAETGLQQNNIRRRPRQREKRRCGYDLEFGDRLAAVDRVDLVEQIAQGRDLNRCAGEDQTLGNADQVGRSVGADSQPGGFINGPQKSDG